MPQFILAILGGWVLITLLMWVGVWDAIVPESRVLAALFIGTVVGMWAGREQKREKRKS